MAAVKKHQQATESDERTSGYNKGACTSIINYTEHINIRMDFYTQFHVIMEQ